MTATPVTVEPETLLADAARIMLDQHITALPVVVGFSSLLESRLFHAPSLHPCSTGTTSNELSRANHAPHFSLLRNGRQAPEQATMASRERHEAPLDAANLLLIGVLFRPV